MTCKMNSYSGQAASSVPRHTSSARQTQRGLAGVCVCVSFSHTHTHQHTLSSLPHKRIHPTFHSLSLTQSLLCTRHLLNTVSHGCRTALIHKISLAQSLTQSLIHSSSLSYTVSHAHVVSSRTVSHRLPRLSHSHARARPLAPPSVAPPPPGLRPGG